MLRDMFRDPSKLLSLILIGLFLYILWMVASSSGKAVDAYVAINTANPSLHEMVMESRRTAVNDGRTGLWIGLVALAAASGFICLGMVAYMSGKTNMLRERRLERNAARRANPPRVEFAPMAPRLLPQGGEVEEGRNPS